MRALRLTLLLPLAAGLLAGCAAEEIVPEIYRPTDDWDAYRHGLELAGLTDTALGSDWLTAAEQALAAPVQASLPYHETGAFRSDEHLAAGYRFAVPRGQRVEVRVEMAGAEPGRIFLDLYRAEEDGSHEKVASGPAADPRLRFEPRRDGVYVLRAQPELLRDGAFELHIETVQALEFPVAGHDVSDIQSVFGAPRDAGRRSHHGVDIFAPRGTPVVAATRGYVTRVDVRDLGGKVIWLRDSERNANLYYAHLDAQEVEEGTWVEAGDVIGRVGNTGNARTTPPHLHFGIYFRGEGPYDPDPYLRPPAGRKPELRADPGLAGDSVTASEGATLRVLPDRRADPVRTLELAEPVRVEAAIGSYYRVRLADGTPGFVAASELN